MSDYLPENWTSAHFDGELSAAEAARAERRLADDQVAREEVESFSELREALSELPTHSLPSGFSTAVLRECEREMLLPAADTSGGLSASTSGTWRPVVAGLLATAALLFLGVRLATSPGQKPERADDENSVVQNNKNNSLERDNAVADNRRIANKATPAPGKAGEFNKDAVAGYSKKPKLSADGQTDDKSKRDESGIEKGKVAPQMSRQKFAAPMGKAGPNLLQSRIDGGSIRIGDVIPYLEVRGQKTAVIELTVVDVQRAVGQLEILLAKNIVNPPTDAKPKASFDYKKLIVPRFAAKKKSKQELVAVYVESNKLQLEAVMAALGRKTGAVHMKLKAPVAAGQVRVTQVAENHLPRTNARTTNKQDKPLSLADAVAMAKGKYSNATGFGGRRGTAKKRALRPTGSGKRGRGSLAKQAAKDARKEQANSGKSAAGSKSNDPAKAKDVQAGKKNVAKQPPSFRLWMQLDNDSPTSRKQQQGNSGGGLGTKDGVAQKDGSKTAGLQTIKPAPGQVRVIFVLRQGPKNRP